MLRKLIETKSLHKPRKTCPEKLLLEKATEKNFKKINPQIKNTSYVIVVISLLYFWLISWKIDFNEKYFLATIFQSKICNKTGKFGTSSFRSFSKNLEDITIKGSPTGSP